MQWDRNYNPKSGCLGYYTKLNLIKLSVLEVGKVWSTLSLALLPGPLWPVTVLLITILYINRAELSKIICIR